MFKLRIVLNWKVVLGFGLYMGSGCDCDLKVKVCGS